MMQRLPLRHTIHRGALSLIDREHAPRSINMLTPS